MPRYAAKVDQNQQEIIDALRKMGASVQTLHAVGQGVPDLAVGFRGETFLMEVKDGSKPPSAQKLTQPQEEWHDAWHGHVCVVRSPEAAIEVLMRETAGETQQVKYAGWIG